MKVSKIKGRIKKVSVFIGVFMASQIINVRNNAVMAKYSDADISEVTGGLGILEDIALAIVGCIGVIFLSYGAVDFATSISSHDTSQQLQGIKKAVGGVVMVAVPIIIKLFT